MHVFASDCFLIALSLVVGEWDFSGGHSKMWGASCLISLLPVLVRDYVR